METSNAKELAEALAKLAQPIIAEQVKTFAPRFFGNSNDPNLKDTEEAAKRRTVEKVLTDHIESVVGDIINRKVASRVSESMRGYSPTEDQSRKMLTSQAFQAELASWVSQALNREGLELLIKQAISDPAHVNAVGEQLLSGMSKQLDEKLAAFAADARKVADAANKAAMDKAIAEAGAHAEAYITQSDVLAAIVRKHIPDVDLVKDLVSEDSIRKMLIRLGLIKQMEITVHRPNGTTVKFDRAHVMFDAILSAAQAGPVMMVGPAGCGKTLLAKQVAEALGLPFYFNGAISSEYKVTGYKDAGGTYHSTPFREAFEKGGVYLFDEVDGSHPQAFLTLNAALANGMMDFPDKTVQQHPNFVCLAAANTYGRGADRKYVGRNALDAASLDRFTVMTMDYDEDLELNITDNPDWTRKVQGWRSAALALKVDHIISTRACVRGAQLLALGMPEDVVAEAVVWKGLDADDVKKIVAKSPSAKK
ncbi:MAG: AAA domain-containing protein [Proteobacteria bacterium]|nr:AAA domain-containing protein [Pseudomonadota bacterium]